MKCICNFRIFLFLLFQDVEKFGSLLIQTEDWLYDEGDDQLKQVYIDKLKEFKVRIRYVLLYSVLSIGIQMVVVYLNGNVFVLNYYVNIYVFFCCYFFCVS